jgi:iron complex outermembrane receptor protein
MDLPAHVHFDAILRYVDEVSDQGVPRYVTLDLRLALQPWRDWEFSVVGQNLLDDRHPEFKPTVIPVQDTEVQRGVYGKITFRF